MLEVTPESSVADLTSVPFAVILRILIPVMARMGCIIACIEGLIQVSTRQVPLILGLKKKTNSLVR